MVKQKKFKVVNYGQIFSLPKSEPVSQSQLFPQSKLLGPASFEAIIGTEIHAHFIASLV